MAAEGVSLMAKLSLLGRAARWADRKFNKPERAIYGAATMGRIAEDWAAQILSADAEMRGSLATMRARARQQVRDNALAAGFISALVDGVLGPDGIGVRPRVRNADGTLDDTTNLAIWETQQRWSLRDYCAADGQSTFVELQRLIFRTWAVDGEVLIRRGYGAPNPFGYDAQLIDADHLDENYNVPASRDQNEIRMGVEVDARGRPVAYHLWDRHPSDIHAASRTRRRIPANQIIHLFLQLRPGQTRGVPPLTPVLLTLKLLDELIIANLMQARIAASAGGYFETDPAHYTPPTSAPDGTGTNAIQMDLEPGVSKQLPPGLHFVPFDPKHPGDQFEPFVKTLQRLVAAGAQPRMSYATLTGDLSETSYSSDRGGRLAERDGWRGVQRWFAPRVLCPLHEDLVRMSVLSGALRVGTFDPTRFLAHDYEYRGWPWVDPLKDINAAGEELALKLTSRQRICAERGRDFETILEELQEEERLAAKYGVSLEAAADPRDLSTLQDPPKQPQPGRALRLARGAQA